MRIDDFLAYYTRTVADSPIIRAEYHNDSEAGIFADQLVTSTFRELFRHEFPATKWMNGGLIPIDTTVSEGAKIYAFQELIHSGEAEIVADNATDLPLASLEGRNNKRDVHTVAVAIRYSTQDVRSSREQGMFSVVSEKAVSAREGNDRKLEKLIRAGKPTLGLFGVTNQPGIIVSPVITGNWDTATPEEIIADVSAVINAQMINSDGVENPDTFVSDLASFTILSTRPRGPGDTNNTILKFLKEAFPMIRRWDWEVGLKNASPSGGRCFLVYANNASRMRVVFPMMMRPLPPIQKGLNIELGFETRFGGVMTPRPRSVTLAFGI